MHIGVLTNSLLSVITCTTHLKYTVITGYQIHYIRVAAKTTHFRERPSSYITDPSPYLIVLSTTLYNWPIQTLKVHIYSSLSAFLEYIISQSTDGSRVLNPDTDPIEYRQTRNGLVEVHASKASTDAFGVALINRINLIG